MSMWQECDQYTCEPPQHCHRCNATRKQFLSRGVFSTKSVNTRRVQITEAAAGRGSSLRGMTLGGSVVDWGGENGPTKIPSHSPGPNASHYEHFRERCGAHLVYNAFWNITNFCVHQMIMRDPMHQVDLGAIVHLLRAILRKFQECVETILQAPGLAASKLQKRFNLMLAVRNGHDGQRYA